MKIKFENEKEKEFFVKVFREYLHCPYSSEANCNKCREEAIKTISELETSESIPTSDEKQFNKEELYDAVCREVTLYEEHDSLKERAEIYKEDILNSLSNPFYGLFDFMDEHIIEYLKEIYNNWNQLSWADYSDEDHVDYLHGELAELLADCEKDMYHPQNMMNILQQVVNVSGYNKMIAYALKGCKSEQNYYELLAFIQNYWEDILKTVKSEDSETPKESEDEVIRHFTGKYAFLSNAYEEEFVHYKISYQNAEAAYQASKAEYDTIRNLFSKLNAHDAKKLGKQLVIRKKWDSKIEMYEVLWDKFYQSPELSVMLMDTKDAVLAPEGIGTFWGMEDGAGENNLGNILMQIRDNLFALEAEEEEIDSEEKSDEESEKASETETNSIQHALDEIIHSITDYEKGVINVDRMTSAITNLAKNLVVGQHACLIADLAELLEHSDNVPKALYDLMRKCKEEELHFIK